MKRGSTCPIVIEIPGVDLTDAEWLIVSVTRPGSRGVLELDATRLEVAFADDTTVIIVRLTQKESLSMGNTCQIDVNWMLDGCRCGATPKTISLTQTLLNRVIGEEVEG